jgi:hypothetical protein
MYAANHVPTVVGPGHPESAVCGARRRSVGARGW